MADYKKNLNEININPLSDDYLKFIRFGHHIINKNRHGIHAYITNSSFLDGIIHREMRKALLHSFDSVHVVDLHGSAKKKEASPDGTEDQNVFDIMQGVNIAILVKTEENKVEQCAKVFHTNLWGKRETKYQLLHKLSVGSSNFSVLAPIDPYFYFVPKDFTGGADYSAGIQIDKLFTVFASGIKTERDALTIQFDEFDFDTLAKNFRSKSEDEIRQLYGLVKDGRDWTVKTAKEDLISNQYTKTRIQYRPFDFRNTIYTGKTIGFHAYPRNKIMKNLLGKKNCALVVSRQCVDDFKYAFATSDICDINLIATAGQFGGGMVFPLYLYADDSFQRTFAGQTERASNLNPTIVEQIALSTGLHFAEQKDNGPNAFSPDDIFGYLYAILYSPSYRKKYKEFLKIDFPRVPVTTQVDLFRNLCSLGSELVNLHFLEGVDAPREWNLRTDGSTLYDIAEVAPGFPKHEEGKVFINKTAWFDGVAEEVWNFYIGGYQVCHKWLKDRKGRTLSAEAIAHYGKITVALRETIRLMAEIDQVIEAHGGFPLPGSVSGDALDTPLLL